MKIHKRIFNSKLGQEIAEYSDMLKAEGYCGNPIYGEFHHILGQMRDFSHKRVSLSSVTVKYGSKSAVLRVIQRVLTKKGLII